MADIEKICAEIEAQMTDEEREVQKTRVQKCMERTLAVARSHQKLLKSFEIPPGVKEFERLRHDRTLMDSIAIVQDTAFQRAVKMVQGSGFQHAARSLKNSSIAQMAREYHHSSLAETFRCRREELERFARPVESAEAILRLSSVPPPRLGLMRDEPPAWIPPVVLPNYAAQTVEKVEVLTLKVARVEHAVQEVCASNSRDAHRTRYQHIRDGEREAKSNRNYFLFGAVWSVVLIFITAIVMKWLGA